MEEYNRKKRANRRQQELLVDRLHNNLKMARGNQTDPKIMNFWAVLSNELNSLGCTRTVQQWQHIWSVWVAKVKTKAHKIRKAIQATGRRPAGFELTDMEQKVIDVIGPASIQGFAKLQMGITPSPPPSAPAPASKLLPCAQCVEEPQVVQKPQQPQADVFVEAGPIRRRIVPRRRSVTRPPRPRRTYSNLVHALQESNSRLHDTIRESAQEIAAALRDSSAATLRAAEILAAAISSAHGLNNRNNLNQ